MTYFFRSQRLDRQYTILIEEDMLLRTYEYI